MPFNARLLRCYDVGLCVEALGGNDTSLHSTDKCGMGGEIDKKPMVKLEGKWCILMRK